MLSKLVANQYIKIRREEYARLKNLQKHFEAFWGYLSHLREIQEAREDVNRGRTISQKKLFEKLEL